MADEAIFVERLFKLDGKVLSARFYTPFHAPGGEYQCRWAIDWPDRPRKRYTCGIDGIQALILAMKTVHSELLESDAYRGGRLTFLEETDLDLPAAWTFDDNEGSPSP